MSDDKTFWVGEVARINEELGYVNRSYQEARDLMESWKKRSMELSAELQSAKRFSQGLRPFACGIAHRDGTLTEEIRWVLPQDAALTLPGLYVAEVDKHEHYIKLLRIEPLSIFEKLRDPVDYEKLKLLLSLPLHEHAAFDGRDVLKRDIRHRAEMYKDLAEHFNG